MMNRITLLGSGTSTGVPILGCKCKVCQSTEPRNKRLRTSALIELMDKRKILIDASPDLRAQLLKTKTEDLDAVIITHDHADHTHGMDDIRPFSFKHSLPIPVFADQATCTSLTRKFPYIFDHPGHYAGKPILGGGIPLLNLRPISSGPQQILGTPFEFYTLPHGHHPSLGFRHEKLAYLIDCRMVPKSTIESLRKAELEILIIDCLRTAPHQTHLHLELTLEYIELIQPKVAILTHMGHEMDYLELMETLLTRGVKNTFPAVDGQTFLYSNA